MLFSDLSAALVSHAVWRHSKKQNTSAPIAMPWLELLSQNSKLFTFFSNRNNSIKMNN